MQWGVAPGSQAEQVGRLFLAGMVVVFLPQLPFGNYLIYPFTILTTWFHEMGHGLTGLALGHEFERLVILPSGSGFAETRYVGEPSPISLALVSAGGPLGPSMVGSLLILASGRAKYWRLALYALAALIGISTLLWIRSAVGLIAMPLVGIAITIIAMKASPGLSRFTLQFLGILAAMSMFQSWDYLFMERAVIGGRPMLSDTGAIEQALLLPHWFWAIAIIGVSGLMIGFSLKRALEKSSGPMRRWN
jgi:hypothetical protein